MTTSGIYTETRTVKIFIEDALKDINAIDEEDSASGPQISHGIRKLNNLILQLKGPKGPFTSGQKMWQRERASLTLSAKNSFDLQPSGGDLDIEIPVEILVVMVKNTDGSETPITPMSYEEYQTIGDKTAEGSPSRYYYEKRIDKGVLYFDFVPSDLTETVEILYRQPLEVVTAQTETIDLEDYMYRMMHWNLAKEMCPRYFDATPQNVLALAQESLEQAQTFYPEDSDEYFEPGRD